MSEALGRLLGSLSTWPREESDISASFGFRDSSYDDGGWDGEPQDHYGNQSGNDYHDIEECCPLVVDFMCVAAIILSIAGAAVFLSRVFQIELCNVNGNDVNTPCNNRRKKRAFGYYEEQLQLMIEGKIQNFVEHFWGFE